MGIAAFWVSHPKKGSVEWHKREYFAFIDRVYDRRVIDRPRVWVESKTGWQLRPNWKEEELRLRMKAETNRLALVESGYITTRRFTIYDDKAVWDAIHAVGSKSGDKERPFITCQLTGGRGVVVVAGPLDDIRFFEELIQKADVPNWGEMLVPKVGVADIAK